MPRPARILHVAAGLGLGGTEKTMQLFVTHLDRARFHASVYSPVDGERRRALTNAGIEVLVGGDLLGLLERLRPDIVHLHRAGWPEPKLLRTLALAEVPFVVETNVFGRFDPSPRAASIDRHLFVSRFCLERYRAINGVPAEAPRHQVLYNPVDTDAFVASPTQRDFAAHTVGRISRPDPGKWSMFALRFIPRVAAALPDFRYRIIGATQDAREWIASRGLEKHVEFCDAVHTDGELAAFLDTLSVMAHANDTGESFGLTIAEAMASGLPVVTHPAEGLRDNAQLELVEHGVTGFVAATDDDYAAAVIRLLTNPEEARAMGEAGRDKATRLFRVQTVVRRLEIIYQELLDSRRPNDRHIPAFADASGGPSV
ncbi:glycosyltransferase involved in cell wall biosynthesis [Desulfobaculum xiamenense]|uniref:Glycosyltransferase involved in cell wall biosynthesis n=1 Tax=Desulfobaculum xiamenense TaxID=995050 RepID=A0A846QH40_9BACT|nr:glycosyltransferase family 4 protein [Desulfobaculum xiamenense]NJB67598.1 glycosyltransferase involved in cell wall biosynthesis [Desulfobaculum xiamenense]